MTDPYEFSRRVRETADGLERHGGRWADANRFCHSKELRDLANEYDSRVARYEAEIAVLRAEVDRLSPKIHMHGIGDHHG